MTNVPDHGSPRGSGTFDQPEKLSTVGGERLPQW